MISRSLTLSFLIAMVLPAHSETSKMSDWGFWSWFESRRTEFAELFSYETGAAAQDDPKLQQKIEDNVAEVGAKLREIHSEFSPFFGFSEGTNTMTVTVHGRAEHFEAVNSFIASAPKLKGWTFIALKQPLRLAAESEIQAGTAKLKIGDWRYTRTKNANGSFDFVVYVPAKVSDDPEGSDRLFTRITMDFLGERLASTIVGEITVRELTKNAPAGLLPFVDVHADISRATNRR